MALSSISGPGERTTHRLSESMDIAPDSTRPIQERLRVMSYNAFLRPAPVGWGDKNECRAERIARRLSEQPIPRDIIVLNETFDKKATRRLAELAEERFPYQALGLPEARGFRTNGGLSILSRYPIEKWSAERFSRCSGEFNDCLATKGILWALVRVSKDLKVNIVATHMNSGHRDSSKRAREHQLDEIREFIDSQHQTKRWPTLLMGDLNINGMRYEPRYEATNELTEYAQSMALLGNSCAACETAACYASCNPVPVDAFRKQIGAWSFEAETTRHVNTHNCLGQVMEPCTSPNDDANWETRSRLDYVMHFGSPKLSPQLDVRVAGASAQPYRDNACGTNFLSDHKAVEATIEFRRDVSLNAQMSAPDADTSRREPSER
ncbi:MAG: sphingomyelin phosphodiesterase [Persicimonas sp.]